MKTRSSEDPVLPTWALAATAFGALIVTVGAVTPPGAALAGGLQRFLSFYAGVFTLLTMTTAVVAGVLASERILLRIHHRVLFQGVHRAASVLAVTFVVAHLLVKVLGGIAAPVNVVVPGVDPVGLGTLAFQLMLVVAATGVLRARFARRARPWVWRSLHSVAYLAWPVGIAHGLTAGRAPANWVVLSYVLCMGAVALAVLTRLAVSTRPRRIGHAGEGLTPAPERRPAAFRAETSLPEPRATAGDPRGTRVAR
ncbi:hypothetical protein ACSNOI_21980 [Actinomadura kijaniata]|uniref:hypothetical protein n=1 Tax=Actinomadura kijaniata TaxID=46161 RepID=UPI003F19ABC7